MRTCPFVGFVTMRLIYIPIRLDNEILFNFVMCVLSAFPFAFDSFYFCEYRKNPKISDTRTFVVITLKVEQNGFSLE